MARGIGSVRALAVAAGVLAVSTACGGSSGDSGSGGSSGADGAGVAADGGGGGDPLTTVTVDVTGDVTLKGSTTALPPTYGGVDYTSCADYGKGETDNGKAYFVLPMNLQDLVDDKQIHVGAEIRDYRGPADYPVEQLTDQGTPAGISFDGRQYFLAEKSTSTVTVTADGGGSWTFAGLSVQNPDSTIASDRLSGSVSWTCSNNG